MYPNGLGVKMVVVACKHEPRRLPDLQSN